MRLGLRGFMSVVFEEVGVVYSCLSVPWRKLAFRRGFSRHEGLVMRLMDWRGMEGG